jgi:hypothetical protein
MTLGKIAEFNKIEMCPGDLEAVEEKRRGRIADMFAPTHLQVQFRIML